jgi:hypothetical protein
MQNGLGLLLDRELSERAEWRLPGRVRRQAAVEGPSPVTELRCQKALTEHPAAQQTQGIGSRP